MFTGLVKDVGTVTEVQMGSAVEPLLNDHAHPYDSGMRLFIETNLDGTDLQLGASVSCNGVCLTVTKPAITRGGSSLVEFFLGHETLRKSQFARISVGDKVNLEPALRYGDPLGGHHVQGHVDGLAKVMNWKMLGEAWSLVLEVDQQHLDWMVLHGSLAVRGVSLTIAGIERSSAQVSMMIIPHTLKKTNFANIKVGQLLEVEFDLQVKVLVESCKKFLEPIVRGLLNEAQLNRKSAVLKSQE